MIDYLAFLNSKANIKQIQLKNKASKMAVKNKVVAMQKAAVRENSDRAQLPVIIFAFPKE